MSRDTAMDSDSYYFYLSANELWTLYFDIGGTADGPWPPPEGMVSAKAREAYKKKLTRSLNFYETGGKDG